MEKVSIIGANGIQSAYFNLNYQPSIDSKNMDLNKECSLFMQFLALADATRNKVYIDLVTSKFGELLLLCKTVEEVQRLSNLMIMTKQVGGYAVDFYELIPGILQEVKDRKKKNITSNESVRQVQHVDEPKKVKLLGEEAEKFLEAQKNSIQNSQIKEEKYLQEKNGEPVSFKLKDGVQSEYFDIRYRPSEDKNNYKLDIACSSFLMTMALADITRSAQQIDDVFKDLSKIIRLCETQEERKNLMKFLEEIKHTGGYAVEFYNFFNGDFSPLSIVDGVEKYFDFRCRKVSEIDDSKMISKYISEAKLRPNFSGADELYGSFIAAMAAVDYERTIDSKEKLIEIFNEMLLACESPKDFLGLKKCIQELSNIGGFAVVFAEEYLEKISKEEKEKLQEEKQIVEKRKLNYNEWKEEYEVALRRMENFLWNSNLDSEELLVVIGKISTLESNIDVIRGNVSAQDVVDIQYALEKLIRRFYELGEWKDEFARLMRMYSEIENSKKLYSEDLEFLSSKFDALKNNLEYLGFDSSYPLIKSLNYKVDQYLDALYAKQKFVDNISSGFSF